MANQQQSTQGQSLETEIKALEAALAAKKAAFESGEGAQSEQFPHKEALKEAVRERYFVPPVPPPPPALPSSSAKAASQAAALRAEEVAELKKEQQVKALVDLAFEKDIFHAVDVAKNLHPFVLDAFHDALVDQFFDEMVKRSSIKEIY